MTEVNKLQEWTLYDDAELVNKGTWKDVIRQCIDITTYPTVLLYEQIDPSQDKYNPTLSTLT